MAGKSAILRQTAIICLLAQIGSFVPAKHAEIGILDKILPELALQIIFLWGIYFYGRNE